MKSEHHRRDLRGGYPRTPFCRPALPALGAGLLALLAGCSAGDLRQRQRYEQGLVIILPGIEGQSPLNVNIARGLAQGGVPSAIEIYDWTFAWGASWLVNLADESRNRHHATEVAKRIVAYRNHYPGRPVHLVGHSGGGGVAVFALEALPTDKPVTSALLLAPAISPDYDLRRALRRTQCGLWNFYSSQDFGFLKVGTTIFGTIDREHGSAAGAVGFRQPPSLGEEGKKLYRARLHQVRYSERMARSGNSGGHTGWASRQFVREWLAPLVYSQIEGEVTFAGGGCTGDPPTANGTSRKSPGDNDVALPPPSGGAE